MKKPVFGMIGTAAHLKNNMNISLLKRCLAKISVFHATGLTILGLLGTHFFIQFLFLEKV